MVKRRLVGYSPWGPKESDMTEQLNWTELHCIVPEVTESRTQLSDFHFHLFLRLGLIVDLIREAGEDSIFVNRVLKNMIQHLICSAQ